METKTKFETVDQYMDTLAESPRQALQLIRTKLLEAAPGAVEIIHYQMPALNYHGTVFIYFAAFKDHYHITVTRPGKAFEAFKDEIAKLDISKSTIRLPKDQPIPFDLLSRIAKFKIAELNKS